MFGRHNQVGKRMTSVFSRRGNEITRGNYPIHFGANRTKIHVYGGESETKFCPTPEMCDPLLVDVPPVLDSRPDGDVNDGIAPLPLTDEILGMLASREGIKRELTGEEWCQLVGKYVHEVRTSIYQNEKNLGYISELLDGLIYCCSKAVKVNNGDSFFGSDGEVAERSQQTPVVVCIGGKAERGVPGEGGIGEEYRPESTHTEAERDFGQSTIEVCTDREFCETDRGSGLGEVLHAGCF